MQIFVAMPGGRVLTLEVEDTWQVAALKAQIQTVASIPPSRQRLMHGSKLGGEPHHLDDARTLRAYNIEREVTLQLAVLPPPLVVELNVGGERHTTLLSTLCRVRGSWLWETFHGLRQGSACAFAAPADAAAAAEGVPPQQLLPGVLERDADGAFVIDRDKASFRFVLAYCRRVHPAAGAVAAELDPGAPPEAQPAEMSPELRAELGGMKLSALKRRAVSVGVDAQLLAEADDTDDIKQTVTRLIAEVVGRPGLDLPTEAADLRQLITEAEFYRLPELAAACRQRLLQGANPSHALLIEMDARAFRPLEQAALVAHGVKTVDQLALLTPSDLRHANVDEEAAARRVAAGHRPVTAAERAELRELLGREAGRISAEARGALTSFVGSVDRLLDMQLSSRHASAEQLSLNLVENRVLSQLLRTQGVRTERQQEYSQQLHQHHGISAAGADAIVAAGCVCLGDVQELVSVPAELARLEADGVLAQAIKLKFTQAVPGFAATRIDDDGSTIIGTDYHPRSSSSHIVCSGGMSVEVLHSGRHFVEVTIPAGVQGGGNPSCYFGVVAADCVPTEQSTRQRSDVAHVMTHIVYTQCTNALGVGTTWDFVVDVDLGSVAYRQNGVWYSLGKIMASPLRWVADVNTYNNGNYSRSGQWNGVVTRVHVQAKPCPFIPQHVLFA